MDLKKYIVPPVAIYAAIFLFISVLVGAKVETETTWVWLVNLVILLVGLYTAANYIKAKDWKNGLTYGVAWVIVLFLLDLILTVPFTGKEFFSDWRTYLSYILTLLVPATLTQKKK